MRLRRDKRRLEMENEICAPRGGALATDSLPEWPTATASWPRSSSGPVTASLAGWSVKSGSGSCAHNSGKTLVIAAHNDCCSRPSSAVQPRSDDGPWDTNALTAKDRRATSPLATAPA